MKRERFSRYPSATGGEITGADKIAPAAFLQCRPTPGRASTNKHGIGDFGRREIKGLVEVGDVFRAIIKFLWGSVIGAR